MSTGHPFHDDLVALGFRLSQHGRAGDRQYVKQAGRYLVYSVHWNPDDGTCLVTWEFAVGEFMDHHGLQIGSNEALNLFLFPQHDARGPAEIRFVASELDRTESVLRSLDFVGGED